MPAKRLLNGKRILIVDDEPDILAVLEDLLPMCYITKTSKFNEAKKLLEIKPFDFAILDIMGVCGFDLLDIAKEKKIDVVMLTAHALSPENIEKSYLNNAASFVPKEKIADIEIFLNDILEARKKGESLWWRWLERMEDYCIHKFGPEWQKQFGVKTNLK
ncbi:MAG: response regulator [Deltaproteobacteria bacterium]|nr:response regulator [Deltaproteobacteria bacterium]